MYLKRNYPCVEASLPYHSLKFDLQMHTNYFSNRLLILFFCLPFSIKKMAAQPTTIFFQLDTKSINQEIQSIGIRGNQPPLSWEKSIPLSDDDGDGIFSVRITFPISQQETLSYKFILNEKIWELDDNRGNRQLGLGNPPTKPLVWNKMEMAPVVISQTEIQEDLAILKKALEALHPGLNRYLTPANVEKEFEKTRRSLTNPQSLRNTYKAISLLTAKIKCSHTYANFWNQGPQVKEQIINTNDKLPFTFSWINRQMVLNEDLSTNDQSVRPRGTKILSINGHSTTAILDSLLQIVKADGGNDAKRVNDLQINGLGKYEAFDVYFPLFFPPIDGHFEVSYQVPDNNQKETIKVKSITRKERQERLAAYFGPIPESYDELWDFEVLPEKVGVLTLGTFVTYKMKMNWKQFIDNAFQELHHQDIQHLIIDIRGNEGGMLEVGAYVARYLVNKKKMIASAYEEKMRYSKVPEELRPYLGTWDNSFYDQSQKVIPIGDGFYSWNNSNENTTVIKPKKPRFNGDVFLLIDASNSSATFFMADIMKREKMAKLFGSTNGGNQRGMNGGRMFFLTLPNSKIEVDIPLIGYYAKTNKPDGGMDPDIAIAPTVEDIISGKDVVIERVLKEIGKKP